MSEDRQVPRLITLSDFTDDEIRAEAEDRDLVDIDDSGWYDPQSDDNGTNEDATAIFEALYAGNEVRAMELVRAWVQNETGRCLP